MTVAHPPAAVLPVASHSLSAPAGILAGPGEAETAPPGGFIRSHGPRLVKLGHPIAPIKPGSKAPHIANWQRIDFNAMDLSRRFTGYGVGVKTGVPSADGHAVIGVDLDISDPAMVELMERWCRERLGEAPVRIGRAPRTMLVFRTSKLFRKKHSRTFRSPDGLEHAVEVLGTGQQFLAYAVHPLTGKPYTWPNGDLTDIPIGELPEITEAKTYEILNAFEANVPKDWEVVSLVHARRIATGNGAHRTSAAPCAPIWKLQLALDAIPILPDDPHAEWIKLGMALHRATDGSPEGLALWDGRSRKGHKYEPGEPERLWKSFGSFQGARLSAATIFKMADDADPSWRERAREAEREHLIAFDMNEVEQKLRRMQEMMR